MAETKYRIPPCPAHDIPAMESWLEDQAARGLHLAKDGFFGLLATFEVGTPKKERFRLEPTDRKGGLFSEEYDPEDEQLQMLRQMGWTYRARRGQFHIFSTDDPNAPELNTDPQVQAMTMEALTRFLRKKLRDTLVMVALYTVLYFGDVPLSSTLLLGTPLVLLLAGALLWDLGVSVKALLVLRGYRRQLRKGLPLPHRSDYRRSGRRYLTARFLRFALWVTVFAWSAARVFPVLVDAQYEPLIDQAVPFHTVADYYPGARVERQNGFLESEMDAWSDFLTPESIDFKEYTQVTQDGETFDVWLSVHYHRTRWEWTARRLAKEFVSQAGANLFEQTAARVFGHDPVVATQLALPDADYCAFFYRNRSSPHIVVQADNVVIQVHLEVLGHGTEPAPEELARMIVSQIQP